MTDKTIAKKEKALEILKGMDIYRPYIRGFRESDKVRLTGLGRDNVRLLTRSRRFPVVKVGKRQVVSILSFVTWQIRDSAGGDYNAH